MLIRGFVYIAMRLCLRKFSRAVDQVLSCSESFECNWFNTCIYKRLVSELISSYHHTTKEQKFHLKVRFRLEAVICRNQNVIFWRGLYSYQTEWNLPPVSGWGGGAGSTGRGGGGSEKSGVRGSGLLSEVWERRPLISEQEASGWGKSETKNPTWEA